MARGVCVRDVLDVIAAFVRDTISPHLWRDEVEVRVRFKGGPWVMLATLHRTELEGGKGTTAAPPGPRKPAFSHSPDYRAVAWGEERLTFSATQAGVVRQLWEAWERGEPGVGQEALLEGVDSDARRLRDLFRHHLAWGRLIVPAGQGVFALAPPD